jgi:hypothetical protein
MLSVATTPFGGLAVIAGLGILATVLVWGDEARQPPEDAARRRPAGYLRCVLIGLVSSALGLYFLLTSPGDAGVADAQRLALGATGTIVGAIFLAAAWRPR